MGLKDICHISNIMALVSLEKDKKTIDRFLEDADFPLYTGFDDYRSNLESFLPGKNWDFFSNGKCSFCDSTAEYENETLHLYACSTCYIDINDGEFDLAKPGDHSVSKKLHQDLRDVIDKEYASNGYYNYMKLSPTPCYVCNQVISEGEIIMTEIGDNYAIAHPNCYEQHGFKGLFTKENYESIIESIEEDLLESVESNKSSHLIPRDEPCNLSLVISLKDRLLLSEMFSSYDHDFQNEDIVKNFFAQWRTILQFHLPMIRQIYFIHNPVAPGGSYLRAKKAVMEYLYSNEELRDSLKNLIDQHYWRSFSRDELKNIKHSHCSFCRDHLTSNDEICVSGNKSNWAMAHWKCSEHGFPTLFTEKNYNKIIKQLEDRFIRILLQ